MSNDSANTQGTLGIDALQMNRDYIQAHDVINRYLQQKLTDEELDAFEVYLLDNPETVDEIAGFEHLKQAYQANQDLLKPAQAKPARPFYRNPLALAACLVIAVGLVFNLPQNEALNMRPPVLLEDFRSQEDLLLQVNGAPGIQFQIAVSPLQVMENNNFSLEIVDQNSGTVIASATDLQADAEAWLYYSIIEQDRNFSGPHQVIVTPAASPDTPQTFEIEFINNSLN